MVDFQKDVALVLAGAVLGGIVTVALNVFQAQSPSVAVIVSSLVILLWLTYLSIRVAGPLHLIFASPAGIRLAGNWKGNFRYLKNGAEVVVSEAVTIYQRGRFIRGSSHSTAISGDFPLNSTAYDFSAILRSDGVLDGTWKNTMPGQRFHGSFQAKVRRDGHFIIGTWIGVDESGINRGEFEWGSLG